MMMESKGVDTKREKKKSLKRSSAGFFCCCSFYLFYSLDTWFFYLSWRVGVLISISHFGFVARSQTFKVIFMSIFIQKRLLGWNEFALDLHNGQLETPLNHSQRKDLKTLPLKFWPWSDDEDNRIYWGQKI